MTIPLIDKQDFFEVVLLQIGAILASETAAQQVLATADSKDPDFWKFGVYLDRYNPVEVFRENPDATPIVNIWWDNSNFSEKESQTVGRQVSSTTYNLDIYAGASSSDNPTGGYLRGDEESSDNLRRIVRLIRNIIMHPDNTYLQLFQTVNGRRQNLIWRRWINSFHFFQPQIDDRPVENVIAARCTLGVTFNELPVVETFEPLEIIHIEAKRAIDGKVVFEAQIDTT